MGIVTLTDQAGSSLPAFYLDFDAAEQIEFGGEALVQAEALAGNLVVLFVSGGNCRISCGEDPVADEGAGSFPLLDGQWIPLCKGESDKISVVGVEGASGKLDIIPVWNAE